MENFDVSTTVDMVPFEQPANEADKALLVKFYTRPVENKEKSLRAGTPVFDDIEHIEIRSPGDRNWVARPASVDDIRRFPQHYEAFKKRQEMPVTGTPLKAWPAIGRASVESLAFLGIKTVQQLASISDGNVPNLPGIGHLRRLAQDYLRAAESDAPLQQLSAELEKRDTEIQSLKQQLNDLVRELGQLKEAQLQMQQHQPSVLSGNIQAAPEHIQAEEPTLTFASVLAEKAQAPEAEGQTDEAPRRRRRTTE